MASIYKKILFPTDFSPGSGHALSHALKLTGVQEAEVIVQHVVSDYFERLPNWTTIFDVHELQRYMDSYVAREMKRIVGEAKRSGLKIRPVVSKGKPAEEINAVGEEEMVDLIVMGRSTGTVSSQVIAEGSRPVMAVPSAETNGNVCQSARRILVAIDFSQRSQKLADYAFRLCASIGATISVMYVIEATCAMEAALREAYFSEPLNRMREWAENQIVSLMPSESLSDPAVRRIVEVGRPSETITKVAKEVRADLIVVGVQDHGRIEEQLLGTDTERILRNAGVTILSLPV